MPLLSANSQPRSVDIIGLSLRELGDRFSIMDIGASEGFDSLLTKPLAPYGIFYGFEPNKEECARLAQDYRDNHKEMDVRLFPVGLGTDVGRHRFYVTPSSPLSDSMLEPNSDFWERFPANLEVRVVGEMEIETVPLSAVVKENDIGYVDYIKTDVEGMDFPILEASKQVLQEQRVLCIVTEFMWDRGPKKGQAPFADYDTFLRGQGFSLFDLDCWRFPRNPLPAGRLLSQLNPAMPGKLLVEAPPRCRTDGQFIGGNALYFRDPIKAGQEGDNRVEWTESRLLKLIALLDIYNYQDFAIEIVDHYRSVLASVDPDVLIDALTPPLHGSVIPYDQYFNISSGLYKNMLMPKLQPQWAGTMPRYTPLAQRARAKKPA